MLNLRLAFSDAVLSRQEPLLHQTLQHRPDGRPVDQLQYEQVGLQAERRRGKVLEHECDDVRHMDVCRTGTRRPLTQQQAVTVIWTVLRPG